MTLSLLGALDPSPTAGSLWEVLLAFWTSVSSSVKWGWQYFELQQVSGGLNEIMDVWKCFEEKSRHKAEEGGGFDGRKMPR